MSPPPYKAIVLDIEGTVCPISFVKDQLFPYFLNQLPSILQKYTFPLPQANTTTNDPILKILIQFPPESRTSQSQLLSHLNNLVSKDIKDPILKQLQGFIWEEGYTTGSISAPLFSDALKAIHEWYTSDVPMYVYSSGSVKAQKLLFANVESVNKKNEDLTGLFNDYFDTVNIGSKLVTSSYEKILEVVVRDRNGLKKSDVLFLSDNPLEIKACLESGMNGILVAKPGNYPLSQEDETQYTVIHDFSELF